MAHTEKIADKKKKLLRIQLMLIRQKLQNQPFKIFFNDIKENMLK